MSLSLLSLFEPPTPARCVAFTGAGGKTSLLTALAESLADRGRSVIVTTTTHIRPPNRPALSPLRGDGPFFSRGRSLPDLAAELCALFRARPGRVLVVGSEPDAGAEKLRGPAPRELCALLDAVAAAVWPSPLMLVEADGAARHPLKAHAEHEPVIPPCADAVVAVMGLDALGRPLAEAVHRPERALVLLGGDATQLVTPDLAASLLLHPGGPFRRAPARRALMLNKTDLPGGEAAALDVARVVAVRAPGLPCHAGSLAKGESHLIA